MLGIILVAWGLGLIAVGLLLRWHDAAQSLVAPMSWASIVSGVFQASLIFGPLALVGGE